MSRKSIFVAMLVGACALFAVAAQAETILVLNNHSFEAPAVGSQASLVDVSGTAKNGWTCYWNSADTWYPPQVVNSKYNTGWGYVTPLDGNNFATYLTIAGATAGSVISQQITTDGTAGFTIAGSDVGGVLTIGINAACRTGLTGGTSISLEVWDGAPNPTGSANKLGSQLFAVPNTNTYSLYAYQYTVQGTDVGKTLWYALRTYPVAGVFDGNNLQLDVASASFAPTVPEPSTLAMLAAGLVGLLAYAWRKRK